MICFAILEYVSTTPNDNFPYNYIQYGHTFKISNDTVTYNTDSVKWACFCIPR